MIFLHLGLCQRKSQPDRTTWQADHSNRRHARRASARSLNDESLSTVTLATYRDRPAHWSPAKEIRHRFINTRDPRRRQRTREEISPGLYRHEFEHVAKDGIRTSISYLARKVKHLVHLDDAEVGLVSIVSRWRCRRGHRHQRECAAVWIVASAEVVNATILLAPTTSHATAWTTIKNLRSFFCASSSAPSSSCLVRTLLLASTCTDYAQSTHFSQAFDHLQLKYYRGKRDAARRLTFWASPAGSESKVGGEDGLGLSVPSCFLDTHRSRLPF